MALLPSLLPVAAAAFFIPSHLQPTCISTIAMSATAHDDLDARYYGGISPAVKLDGSSGASEVEVLPAESVADSTENIQLIPAEDPEDGSASLAGSTRGERRRRRGEGCAPCCGAES